MERPAPLREATPSDLSFMLACRLRAPIRCSSNSSSSVHHDWPPTSLKSWLHSLYPSFIGHDTQELERRARAGDSQAQLLMGDVMFCGFGLVNKDKNHYTPIVQRGHECKSKACRVCFDAAIDWYNVAPIPAAKVQMAIILKIRYMQKEKGHDLDAFRAACLPLPARQDGGHLIIFLEQAASEQYVSIFTILTAVQFKEQGRDLPPHMERAYVKYKLEMEQQQQQHTRDEEEKKRCSRRGCHEACTERFVCGLCRSKSYCCAACQIDHWTQQHRLVCTRKYDGDISSAHDESTSSMLSNDQAEPATKLSVMFTRSQGNGHAAASDEQENVDGRKSIKVTLVATQETKEKVHIAFQQGDKAKGAAKESNALVDTTNDNTNHTLQERHVVPTRPDDKSDAQYNKVQEYMDLLGIKDNLEFMDAEEFKAELGTTGERKECMENDVGAIMKKIEKLFGMVQHLTRQIEDSQEKQSVGNDMTEKLSEMREQKSLLEKELLGLLLTPMRVQIPSEDAQQLQPQQLKAPPLAPRLLDISQVTDKSRDVMLDRLKYVATVALNSDHFHEGTTIPELVEMYETLILSKNYTDALVCLSFAAQKILLESALNQHHDNVVCKLLGKFLGERINVMIQVARVSPTSGICDRILVDCTVVLRLGLVKPLYFSKVDFDKLVRIEQEIQEIINELPGDSNGNDDWGGEVVPAAAAAAPRSTNRRKRSSNKGKRRGGKKKACEKGKPKPVLSRTKLVHLSSYLVISGVATNATSSDDFCPICHVQWRHMDTDDACYAMFFRKCQHAVCAKCVSSLHKSCQETFENETAEEEQQVRFVCTLCRERLPKNLPTDAAKEIVSRNLVESFPQFVEFFPPHFDTKSILISQLLEHDFQISKVENAMFATMQLLGSDHHHDVPPTVQQDVIYDQARFPVQPLYWKVRDAEKKVDKIWNTASREYQEALIDLNRARKDLKVAKINAMKDVYERMNHAVEENITGNSDDLVCVDLHGLHPYEAPRILAEFVLPALPVLTKLVVITGRGNHSESGESALKQKVSDYLSSKIGVVQSVTEVENNPGRLLVIGTTASSS